MAALTRRRLRDQCRVVVPQHMRVVLGEDAAAARRADDRLDAAADASSSRMPAATLRRTLASAASVWPRWCCSAPQQPIPSAVTSETPSRSSTRAAAALICGASPGCTQPSSTAMRRAMPWRGPVIVTGAECGVASRPAQGLAGALGSSGRSAWPSRTSGVNSRASRRDAGQRESHESLARAARDAAGCCSTSSRPTSTSRPYCTPDGHAVSQARQVRQRSRWSRCRHGRGARSRRPA